MKWALVVLVLAHQVAGGVVEPLQPGVFVLRFCQLAVGVVGEGFALLRLAGGCGPALHQPAHGVEVEPRGHAGLNRFRQHAAGFVVAV